jgi:SOS response regulatory protein OraA/RecX
VKSALRLLGYSDKSRKQLFDMLVRRGFSPEVADEATEEAVRLGYLNERRAIEHAIVHMVEHKHYGARRITLALVEKGYPKPLVREVISILASRGEIDFKEAFKALLLKKRVQDIVDESERKEKIKKLAYQYGFK